MIIPTFFWLTNRTWLLLLIVPSLFVFCLSGAIIGAVGGARMCWRAWWDAWNHPDGRI